MALRAGDLAVDNFPPGDVAEAVRRDIEARFAKLAARRAATPQVWNDWFGPEPHTDQQTSPEKVIARERVDAVLRNPARLSPGCDPRSCPQRWPGWR